MSLVAFALVNPFFPDGRRCANGLRFDVERALNSQVVGMMGMGEFARPEVASRRVTDFDFHSPTRRWSRAFPLPDARFS